MLIPRHPIRLYACLAWVLSGKYRGLLGCCRREFAFVECPLWSFQHSPRTRGIKPGRPLGAVLVRKPQLDEGLLGLGLDSWAGGCGLVLFSGPADGMPWEVLCTREGAETGSGNTDHGFKNSYWKIFYEQICIWLKTIIAWIVVYKIGPMNRLKLSFMSCL